MVRLRLAEPPPDGGLWSSRKVADVIAAHLGLENAGFHTRPNLAAPDSIRLVHLPPDSPELQPAETLWPLVDEPVVRGCPVLDTAGECDVAVSFAAAG